MVPVGSFWSLNHRLQVSSGVSLVVGGDPSFTAVMNKRSFLPLRGGNPDKHHLLSRDITGFCGNRRAVPAHSCSPPVSPAEGGAQPTHQSQEDKHQLGLNFCNEFIIFLVIFPDKTPNIVSVYSFSCDSEFLFFFLFYIIIN